MSEEVNAIPVTRDRWHEALVWHSHLKDASEAELDAQRPEWLQWEADPENRDVFDKLVRILENASQLPVRPRVNGRDAAKDSAPTDSSAWRPPWSRREALVRRISLGRVSKVVALAAVLSAVALSIPVQQSVRGVDNSNLRAQVHQTAVGEIRSDLLEDGSTVTLGADSRISVSFTADHRAVSLDKGDAWFKVAHAPKWPFEVTAGEKTIIAVGTAFVIRRTADQVVVTVTDGTVEVAPRRIAQPQPLLLRALDAVVTPRAPRVARGERITYGNTGSPSPIELADPQSATSWSEGQLEFDHVPLKDVVRVVNRYSDRNIAVDDAAGAQLFTGLILSNQVGEWLQGLTRIYPVKLTDNGSSVCVHTRTPVPDSSFVTCNVAH